MLQIFEKGKATALFRDTETRVPLEDILTGAVFGIVEYVDTKTAIEMLKVLLGNEKPFDFPTTVTKTRIKFWQRSGRSRGGGWIEPDILIDLFSHKNHHSLRIIVESKWEAGLHDEQAIDQWLHFAGKADRSWHVFPVRRIARIEQMLDDQDRKLASSNINKVNVADWKRNRRCVSWFDIARELLRFAKDTDGPADRSHFCRWARGVLSVLRFLGEKPFEGFCALSAVAIPERPVKARVFWMGSGVREFAWPAPIKIEYVAPIFFNNAR